MPLEMCRYKLMYAISGVLEDSHLDRFVLVCVIPKVQKHIHRY